MKKKKNNKKIFLIVIFVLCSFVLYYGTKYTYTSYESAVDAKVNSKVAGINVSINGQNIVKENLDSVKIDNINFTSIHTREGKVSPGSTGTFDITLDPTGSDVAFRYDFELIDKNADSDKLLTFNGFTSNNANLIKTASNTYTGIVTLDDINNNKVINIIASFSFNDDDTTAISEDNGNLDDFFEIRFHAIQYNGEEITTYNG